VRQLRDHNRIAFETVESHLEAAAFRVRERIDVQPPRTALATDPANPAAIDARTLIASHEGKNTRGKKRSLGTDSGKASAVRPVSTRFSPTPSACAGLRPGLHGVSHVHCCMEVTPDKGIVRKPCVTRPYRQNGYSPHGEIC